MGEAQEMGPAKEAVPSDTIEECKNQGVIGRYTYRETSSKDT